MSIFEYTPEELLGTVESVDTSTVIVKVENDDKLRGLQVNHLISIQSSICVRVDNHPKRLSRTALRSLSLLIRF